MPVFRLGHSRVRALLCSAVALAFSTTPAVAQDADAPPQADPQQAIQLMYREALQSIAEGRKNDASATLEKLVTHEAQHAGAWLELALIQCSLGHATEAERLFNHIEQNFDPPPGIQELINDTRARGCSSWQPLSQMALNVGRGIDQNVNQGSKATIGLPVDLDLTADFRPMHDQYLTLTADYVRDLTSNGITGFVQFQGRRYDRLNQYDSTSFFAGVESPWRFGRWTMRASAMAGVVGLGGKLYQQQAQLQARVGVPLPLPTGYQFHLITGYSHVYYRTISNFNANNVELKGLFSYRNELNYSSASLSFIDDDATANRPGGDRTGWQFNANWRRGLPHDFIGEVGFSAQRWDGKLPYSPGIIDTVRKQTTTTWRAAITYPISRKQSIVVEGRILHNKENIPIFQYNDRQLQISWQWQRP
jgi:hypothetical protein